MVTSIPSSKEFETNGKQYLNLCWNHAISVLLDYEESEPWYHKKDEDLKADYSASAHHELATAITLAAQGTEFLLKSRIASVSPWLLISKSPQEWPRGCNTNDLPFAKFRTVDAQDLIKIHDTFCKDRLSEKFKELFDALRIERNSFVHNIDESIEISVSRVLGLVLELSEFLVGEKTWLSMRREHLRDARQTLFYPLYSEAQTVREMIQLIKSLEPSVLKRHFGFNKKQRAYL